MGRISVGAHPGDSDGYPLVHLPDPAAALVWRRTADGRDALLVVGPRTHALYYAGKDIPLWVRVRIRTGFTRAVLGVPASDVVDRVVALDDLWGPSGERLTDELSAVGHDSARAVARLTAALSSRVSTAEPGERTRANLVHAAAVELAASRGVSPARISAVARHVGVSERQLRNLFTATVGVPPKRFACLSRVRTIVSGARRRSWARLASDAGYYDQSHMTAEFRQVMHVTPSAFASGQLPTTSC
jgi:AraC-like DNA-binding protein